MYGGGTCDTPASARACTLITGSLPTSIELTEIDQRENRGMEDDEMKMRNSCTKSMDIKTLQYNKALTVKVGESSSRETCSNRAVQIINLLSKNCIHHPIPHNSFHFLFIFHLASI